MSKVPDEDVVKGKFNQYFDLFYTEITKVLGLYSEGSEEYINIKQSRELGDAWKAKTLLLLASNTN